MANREQFSELDVLQNKGVTQKDLTCLEMEGWGSCDAFFSSSSLRYWFGDIEERLEFKS